MATRWSDEQKADALARLAAGDTLADTARATSIPKPTLIRWAKADGITVERSTEKTAHATEAAKVVTEQRRQALAAGLMADAEKLRRQLFAPCEERRAMVVSGGKGEPGAIEQVTIEHDQPPFGDQVKIITAVAIAVDKIQVLTGEATERIEHGTFVRDEVLAAAREKARHLHSVPA